VFQTQVSSAKIAEPMKMPFGALTDVGQKNHVLHGELRFPTGMGNFGVEQPIENHWGVSAAVYAKIVHL